MALEKHVRHALGPRPTVSSSEDLSGSLRGVSGP